MAFVKEPLPFKVVVTGSSKRSGQRFTAFVAARTDRAAADVQQRPPGVSE